MVAVSFALQADEGACSKEKAACDKSKAGACEKVKVGTCNKSTAEAKGLLSCRQEGRGSSETAGSEPEDDVVADSHCDRARSLLQPRGGDFLWRRASATHGSWLAGELASCPGPRCPPLVQARVLCAGSGAADVAGGRVSGASYHFRVALTFGCWPSRAKDVR